MLPLHPLFSRRLVIFQLWSEYDLIFSYVDDYRDSWKLFRRLFLVDNISGRQEASSEGKHETCLLYTSDAADE